MLVGCIRYVVEQAGANSFFDDFLSRCTLGPFVSFDESYRHAHGLFG